MAILNPPTTPTGLNDLKIVSGCYLPQCLGEDDRLAIEIMIRLKHLAVIPNGTNYSLAAAQAAAALWLHRLSPEERSAIELYLTLKNATNDGAQFPNGTTVNGLKKDAKCAFCMGIEAKRNLALFLKWKIETLGKPS